MMYQDALTKVNDLRARMDSGFSNQDKLSISKLYSSVLGKSVVNTRCSDCYRDALIEVYNYLKRERKMKEKCDYSLKNGVVLQFFGTSEVYTNVNLTNDVSEKYLKQFPAAAETLFAHTPADLEDRLAKYDEKQKEETVALNENLVQELAEKLAGDVTKKSLKEEYREYEIDGKKVTARLLDAHIKAADELNLSKGGK
ncbi:MAG: hypothetical protein GY706_11045 [Bacteroides sp.]|nr:hypothetical protein [Bacteroides sp.]